MTSILLRAAVIVDPRHEELLRKKCRIPESAVRLRPVKEEVALHHLLSVAVPNFSEVSIERILELREDDLWHSFREFLRDIVSTIKADPEVLIDPQQLEGITHKRVDRVLFDELKKKYSTRSELAIDLGLGITSLIPGFGILPTLMSSTKSVHKYLEAFYIKLSSSFCLKQKMIESTEFNNMGGTIVSFDSKDSKISATKSAMLNTKKKCR